MGFFHGRPINDQNVRRWSITQCHGRYFHDKWIFMEKQKGKLIQTELKKMTDGI
jgi:hypothetical protein